MSRVYLSPPHLSGEDTKLVTEALASGWIAPLGPDVDAFQKEFAECTGAKHAVAVSSGTAALHLALIAAGVQPGDEVFVSTLTFIGSVSPIRYVGAVPVFIDSESASWNMDPELLDEALVLRARQNRLPRAVVLVHLYGQCADIDSIRDTCERHGVLLIEDAAEALGATYKGRAPGNDGFAGFFSFNGNKIITTSGGGMLVTPSASVAARAIKLATQARESAAHYEHAEIGYNYRMSNILAALGRGQLRSLSERVRLRRRTFARYSEALSDLPGIALQPEAAWGTHSRWLTTITIDPASSGNTCDTIRAALEAADIEARPLWKPMHLQPVFKGCDVFAGAVSESLFARGLCLPSGSSLTDGDQARICDVIRKMFERV